MKELEAKMRSIEMDGLTWGAGKFVPVGFGIKKLQVNLVVEDEKVSIDDLQAKIEEDEDHVQSTDVVSYIHLLDHDPPPTLKSSVHTTDKSVLFSRLPCKSCRHFSPSLSFSPSKSLPISLVSVKSSLPAWARLGRTTVVGRVVVAIDRNSFTVAANVNAIRGNKYM